MTDARDELNFDVLLFVHISCCLLYNSPTNMNESRFFFIYLMNERDMIERPASI